MKKIFLISLLMAVSTVFSQSIIGKYEQETANAPKGFKFSEEDVVVSRDQQSSKKIWITGIFPKNKFYAMLDTKTPDGAVYTIPKQKVGNYDIEIGCIVYDGEENRIVISINNRQDCEGYGNLDEPISVGKGGVKGGGVDISSKGSVKVGDVVSIKNGDVNVNTKKIMEGITYIGTKI